MSLMDRYNNSLDAYYIENIHSLFNQIVIRDSKYIIIDHYSVAISHEYTEHPWPVFNLFVQYRFRNSNKRESAVYKQILHTLDMKQYDQKDFVYKYIIGFKDFHKFLGRVVDIKL